MNCYFDKKLKWQTNQTPQSATFPIPSNSANSLILFNSLCAILIKINMSIHNSSYFNRHKLALNQSKTRSNKSSIHNPPVHKSSILEQNDSKMQESLYEKNRSNTSYLELELNLPKSEQQKIYEEYREIKGKYEQELKQINAEIQKLKKETEDESRKVKNAENALEAKKKELKATKRRYQEMKESYQKEQYEEITESKIQKLEQELLQISTRNEQKIRELNEEEEKMKEQNLNLAKQLQNLQQQYAKSLKFDHTEYESERLKLEEEENKLKQQLAALQKQGQKLKSNIQKIQDMKPVSSQVHKRYLDLFEKLFISQQLSKAQKIMGLKQEQRKHNIELARRKEWLKQKQKQIQDRQTRIAEKNKTIDKLTLEIRQKSTLLLTKYQVEADKFDKLKK